MKKDFTHYSFPTLFEGCLKSHNLRYFNINRIYTEVESIGTKYSTEEAVKYIGLDFDYASNLLFAVKSFASAVFGETFREFFLNPKCSSTSY